MQPKNILTSIRPNVYTKQACSSEAFYTFNYGHSHTHTYHINDVTVNCCKILLLVLTKCDLRKNTQHEEQRDMMNPFSLGLVSSAMFSWIPQFTTLSL